MLDDSLVKITSIQKCPFDTNNKTNFITRCRFSTIHIFLYSQNRFLICCSPSGRIFVLRNTFNTNLTGHFHVLHKVHTVRLGIKYTDLRANAIHTSLGNCKRPKLERGQLCATSLRRVQGRTPNPITVHALCDRTAIRALFRVTSQNSNTICSSRHLL